MTVGRSYSLLAQLEALLIHVCNDRTDFIFRDIPKTLPYYLHQIRPSNKSLGVKDQRILLRTMAQEIG